MRTEERLATLRRSVGDEERFSEASLTHPPYAGRMSNGCSTATAMPLLAMGVMRQVAEQLRATHGFEALHPAMTHPEAQLLMAPR